MQEIAFFLSEGTFLLEHIYRAFDDRGGGVDDVSGSGEEFAVGGDIDLLEDDIHIAVADSSVEDFEDILYQIYRGGENKDGIQKAVLRDTGADEKL
jgi:hypothetical protein